MPVQGSIGVLEGLIWGRAGDVQRRDESVPEQRVRRQRTAAARCLGEAGEVVAGDVEQDFGKELYGR